MSRSRIAVLVLFFATFLVPTTPAQATSTMICTGFTSCQGAGYSHGGYAANKGTSYWNMYTGTNCTNYVAYRLVTTNRMPNKRPQAGVGNAQNWGKAMSSVTDAKPVVGSVAWWGTTGHHVAYVEKVVSATEIWVSESNWNGAFDWRRIIKTGKGWPDGFIHFKDPAPTAVTNVVRPSVPSPVIIGEMVTAVNGTWSAKARFTYQWLANGKPVPGATTKRFVPTTDLVGKGLSVTVTANNSDGLRSGKATAAAVAVGGARFRSTAPPTIAGVPRVDAPLRATTGTWSTASLTYAYQWFAGGKPVSGATSQTFTPGATALGLPISVAVTARRPGFGVVTSSSAATAPVALASMTKTAGATIVGAPRIGALQTASPGTSTPVGTSTLQWFAGTTAIAGATGKTFTPGVAQRGAKLFVRVTVQRPGYTPLVHDSPATQALAPGLIAVSRAPVVTGSLTLNSRVSVSPGAYSPAGKLSYQWFSAGKAVRGATGTAYKISRADLDHNIYARVTVTADGYASRTDTSAKRKVPEN